MSLFKKIFKGVKKVAKVGLRAVAATNPYAAAATTLLSTASSARQMAAAPRSMAMNQSLGGVNSMSLLSLPSLARGAGTLTRSAGNVIRRNAGTIGTVATAGAILYDAAGNPVRRKRPRSKGITARELKSFTRVTGLLNKYCKTPPPTKRRSASKGRSCR